MSFCCHHCLISVVVGTGIGVCVGVAVGGVASAGAGARVGALFDFALDKDSCTAEEILPLLATDGEMCCDILVTL